MGFWDDLNNVIGGHKNLLGVDPISTMPLIPLENKGYPQPSEQIQGIIQFNPVPIYRITLNLATAQTSDKPFKILVPGRSFVGYGFQTNTTTKVRKPDFIIGARINVDRVENEFPVTHARGYRGDFTQLFLNWPAQANTSVDFIIHIFTKDAWEQEITDTISNAPLTNVNITQVGGAPIAEGQATMANSFPVVIASDQSSVPVTVGNFPAEQAVNLNQVGGAAYSLGQKTMANSAPVVIASDQSAVPISGTVSIGAQPIEVELFDANEAAITLGQKTMANSLPVVIASDQSSVPVTVGNFPAEQAVNLNQVGGSAYSLGQKTMANSAPVVIASDQSAIPVSGFPAEQNVNLNQVGGAAYSLGSKTSANSAPVVIASDQADVGVNIDKYGGSATTLGQKTMANSVPVVLASDQSTVNVNVSSISKTAMPALTPSAPTAATVGVASAQAVASNANRTGLILKNTSANKISLGFGANAAVLNSGITLFPGESYNMGELDFNTQAVNAIAGAASSNLAVQEFT